MGATNNIKEIIQDYQLIKRTCSACFNNFTQQDIQENNYQVWYRTNNDTNWADFKEGESRGWIALEIQLEHEACPSLVYQVDNSQEEKDHD